MGRLPSVAKVMCPQDLTLTPSASSGQALRQAQDRPFGKLRTDPTLTLKGDGELKDPEVASGGVPTQVVEVDSVLQERDLWIPAFAGMTDHKLANHLNGSAIVASFVLKAWRGLRHTPGVGGLAPTLMADFIRPASKTVQKKLAPPYRRGQFLSFSRAVPDQALGWLLSYSSRT